MAKNSLAAVIESIEKAQKIGLATHYEPDGDAYCSALALAEILKIIGKEIVIFADEELPRIFELFNGDLEFQPQKEYQSVDLLITLDAPSPERLMVSDLFKKARGGGARIVSIDHHQPGDFEKLSDVYWDVPEASSTSELIYHISQELHLKPNKKIATLLVLGIESDTQYLQTTNTNKETYAVVAELLKCGARMDQIVKAIDTGRSIPSLKLLGLAIKNLKVDERTGVGITKLSLKELSSLGISKESTTGIANFLDQLKEVKITVVLEERADGMVKGSMRSNNSDLFVNEAAGMFGGGGHKKAAGFLVQEDINKVAEKILAFYKHQS